MDRKRDRARTGRSDAKVAPTESCSGRLARALRNAGLTEWSLDVRSERWLIAPSLEGICGRRAQDAATAIDADANGAAAGERARRERSGLPSTFSTLEDCLYPADVPIVAAAYRRLVDAGEAMKVEVRITRGDGQPRWIRIDGEVSAGAGASPTRLSGHVRDITELKRLRAANGFLACLATPLAQFDDYDDTLQHVANEAVPFLADRCIIEFVLADGTLRRAADSLHPPRTSPSLPPERSADRVPAAPLIDRIVREHRTLVLPDIGEREIRALCATEEDRDELRAFKPCDYIGTPLATDGRCFGVLGILTRRDGRRFTSQEPELVERVADRIAAALENARLYATLRQADERKTYFLAVLSHELRNPLAAIGAGLDAIRASVVAPTERSTLAMIDRQASALSRLVDDLLDIARIDADKVELDLDWVSMSQAIDDALAGVAPVAHAKRQRLASRLPTPDFAVRADRVRLEQILVNLLVNASRYTPEGGSLAIGAHRADGSVVIEVSDTGIGLDEEERHRAFERFEQMSETHSLGRDGLGLGLHLVRALVRLHGGTITAESAGKGHGSRFRVTLPHVRRNALEAGPEPAERRRGDAVDEPLRVLVIDDNEDAAGAIERVLARLGHEVGSAFTGREGVSAYRATPAELVLLDIGLPDIDGYDVAGRIREHERRERLAPCHLVALTGYGQASDRRRALDIGFDEHVVKPVRLERLRALARSARRSSRDAGRD